MENNKDFDYIKARFNALPEITLPSSLTAESLWARIDAGELSENMEAPGGGAPKRGAVVEWVRRMRPVLSYAAVFVVMVAVYYGAGLDSAPPAPATAEPQMMMASPPMAESAEGAPETHNSKSRMVGEANADSPAPRSSPEGGVPMPAAAPPMSDGTELNPKIPGLSDAEEAQMAEENRLRYEKHQQSLKNATAMEEYLRLTLSPKDYGGIDIFLQATATLNIWTVNREAIRIAIADYTGEQCEIVTKDARCSLEALKIFADALEQVPLEDGEMLRAYLSERDNTVAVNISKAGEDRLKREIDRLAQENGMPSECVTVFTLDPEAPNIDT